MCFEIPGVRTSVPAEACATGITRPHPIPYVDRLMKADPITFYAAPTNFPRHLAAAATNNNLSPYLQIRRGLNQSTMN